jgi:hypothetical protein
VRREGAVVTPPAIPCTHPRTSCGVIASQAGDCGYAPKPGIMKGPGLDPTAAGRKRLAQHPGSCSVIASPFPPLGRRSHQVRGRPGNPRYAVAPSP